MQLPAVSVVPRPQKRVMKWGKKTKPLENLVSRDTFPRPARYKMLRHWFHRLKFTQQPKNISFSFEDASFIYLCPVCLRHSKYESTARPGRERHKLFIRAYDVYQAAVMDGVPFADCRRVRGCAAKIQQPSRIRQLCQCQRQFTLTCLPRKICEISSHQTVLKAIKKI